ncbi:MAG: nuclear transport factor 2 family protein [Pseudomonadota bacterium]
MSSIEVTQSLFTHFGQGDVDAILTHLHDEIVIEFYGPPAIPYAGTHRGKDEARRFFETVLASVDIEVFEPHHFIGEGERVAVVGELRLTPKSTGQTFSSAFAHIITLKDNKWIRFQDFMNTAVGAAAFEGKDSQAA